MGSKVMSLGRWGVKFWAATVIGVFWQGNQTDLGEVARRGVIKTPLWGFLKVIRAQERIGVHSNSRLNQTQEAGASAQDASIWTVTSGGMDADCLCENACPQSKVVCINAPASTGVLRRNPVGSHNV